MAANDPAAGRRREYSGSSHHSGHPSDRAGSARGAESRAMTPRTRRARTARRLVAARAGSGQGKAEGDDVNDESREARREEPSRRSDPPAGWRPDSGQPEPEPGLLRPASPRDAELHHRPVHDPAVPLADLPGLRHRVRRAVVRAGVDQPDRDRLRDQPQRLDRGRPGLDAVHAGHLGRVRGGREQRRAQGPLQPGRRDLRGGELP